MKYNVFVLFFLHSFQDPQNTCNTIGFCGMLPKLRVSNPCLKFELLARNDRAKQENLANLLSNIYIFIFKDKWLCLLQVKSGDPCTDCKAFFGDVKMVLSNATTQVSLFTVYLSVFLHKFNVHFSKQGLKLYEVILCFEQIFPFCFHRKKFCMILSKYAACWVILLINVIHSLISTDLLSLTYYFQNW